MRSIELELKIFRSSIKLIELRLVIKERALL